MTDIAELIRQPAVQSFESYRSIKLTHFYVTGEIGQADEYIPMIHAIRQAGGDEVIYIHLNTVGGYVNTTVQLLAAIDESDATIITSIEGECHSAGTLLFLAGDQFIVHDHSIMLIHNMSGGAIGKSHEQAAQIHATSKWYERLIRQLYFQFLTEEELKAVLHGEDLWLDSANIRKRLIKLTKFHKEQNRKLKKEEQANAERKNMLDL